MRTRKGASMGRTILILAAIAVCVGNASASFSNSDAGTSAAPFLKLGAGARAAGMGEAFAGVADDADGVYWNPAGLNRVEGKSLSVMHALWFEEVAYSWASYAQRFTGLGTVGIGVQYLSYGSIEGTDSSGLPGAGFTPADMSVALSYADEFKGIDFGISAKYVSSTIKETAGAYAVDLGVQRRFGDKLALGAAVQNIGTRMKFVAEEDALPLNVKIGGAYAIRPGWQVALDVNAPVDYEPVYNTGTEYVYKINDAMSAAGRLGYSTRAADTGGLNGVTAGLGFTCRGYTVDYAFVPYGELGNTHRVSLGVRF